MKNLKTDVTGIITVSSDDARIQDFLVESLLRKEVVGVVDFSNVSDEKELEKLKDKNFKLNTLLDFTAIGNPTFKDSLENLKNSLAKVAEIGSEGKGGYQAAINGKWVLIFNFDEREEENVESKIFGICNGLDDHDFEVIDALNS